jgi:hypothetical protein
LVERAFPNMERSLGGPAIVLALVLAETAVGGLLVLWLSPAWGRVKLGFFKLTGAVLATAAGLAWATARAPLLDAPGATRATRAGVALLAAFAAASIVWQLLLWAGAHAVSRATGIAAVPVGVAALAVLAADPAVRVAAPIAAFQRLAGAVFAGAVTDGLLLGHWHLVDRRASRAPLARINQYFIAGCALAAVAALAGGTGGGRARPDLSPLLGVGALTVSIAVGLAALCALIAFFIRVLIRENSLQSATGLFYLGVILALSSEFAAKVRFF